MLVKRRADHVTADSAAGAKVEQALKNRLDVWGKQQQMPGAKLAYKKPYSSADTMGLLREPGQGRWKLMTCPTSLREVEPGIRLLLVDEADLGEESAPEFHGPGAAEQEGQA